MSSPMRMRSPQTHTSIEAGNLNVDSPTIANLNKGALRFKAVAALGVVALAAVSGVAYARSSHLSNPNEYASAEGSHDHKFEGLVTCAAVWGQCGGQNWNGPTCCASGSSCSAQSQWYSQCLPTGSTPFPTFTPQPTSATPSPTTPGLVANWGQCGGLNYKGVTSCASSTSTCSIQSDWYSQCLPAGTTPFPWVDYSFNQIVSGVVLNPRTIYNGDINGGATQVNGYEGKGLQLNGVNGNVIVRNSTSWDFSSSGFTLSANVKRLTATNEDGIITKWYGTDTFLLKFDGNTLSFTVHFVTAGYKVISYKFPNKSYLNQWGFVKATYQRTGASGSTMKLWWNGNLVGTLSVTDNMIVQGDIAVHVGNTNNNFSFFNGVLDNVKIWNAAV